MSLPSTVAPRLAHLSHGAPLPPAPPPAYAAPAAPPPPHEPAARRRAGPIAAAVVACLLAIGTAVAVPNLIDDDSPPDHRSSAPSAGARPGTTGPGTGSPTPVDRPDRNGSVAPTGPTSRPAAVPPTSVTDAPPAAGETRHSLQGITFAVPAGWVVEPGLDGPNVVCVLPPAALVGRPLDGCDVDGVEIRLPDPPGDEWARALDLESGSGWVWAGDAWCRGAVPRGSSMTTSSAIVERGFRPVGSKTADYRRWQASCANGSAYHPRVWWLPVTKLSIETFALPPSLDATVDRIAASFNFSGYAGAQG